jgi:ribosomal protein L11 methyltransferase
MSKDQSWIEVTIPGSLESLEAVGNFLLENGSCGLERGEGFIKAYFERGVFKRGIESRLETYIISLQALGNTVGSATYDDVPPQDWMQGWREYFKPVQITPRIIVKPPWEAWAGYDDTVVIDILPGMAFGTGTHESTQLCMGFIESCMNPRDTVLDVGTGSGILAIAAAKLGASRVLAIDIDEDAVENARENIKINNVGDVVKVRKGEEDAIGDEVFGLIVANIDGKTLIHFVPRLIGYIKTGGRMILSGLLTDEIGMIENSLPLYGWRITETRNKGEWAAVVVGEN